MSWMRVNIFIEKERLRCNELGSQDEIEQVLNIINDLKSIRVFQLKVSNDRHIARISKGVFLKGES